MQSIFCQTARRSLRHTSTASLGQRLYFYKNLIQIRTSSDLSSLNAHKMAPIAIEDIVETPVVSKKAPEYTNGAVQRPQLARCDANDPATTTDLLIEIIERDGGVIVENIISQELAGRIKTELKPYFDTDKVDASGFFPHTTQRATGLLGRSDGCVELAMNPTFINVANRLISSTYTYWTGQTQETVTAKPIISSTVGFRVNPGGKQQGLHRDDG